MASHKRLLIMTLLFVFAALPAQAFACSIVPPAIRVRCAIQSNLEAKKICLGGDCSTTIKIEQDGAHVVSPHLDGNIWIHDGQAITVYGADAAADVVTIVQEICSEDMSDIHSPLIQAIESGRQGGGYSLTLTAYSASKEDQLKLAKENYGNCSYEEFTRINDWLLSHDAARSYCVDSIRLGYLCPISEVSSVRFLGFLLTHIDRNTLPYLSGYLLGLATLVGMIVIAYRRGVLQAFRPTIWTLLGALAGSIALAIIGSLVNFFVYLIIVYIVLCFIRGMLTPRQVNQV
jgi:hypothetical protein